MNAPAPSPRPRGNLREAEPGYVLHTYAFKETSLVAELFTRNAGRVGLVAKGARRPTSAMRGALMAFQPLLLTWSGKSELKVLHRVEWQGGLAQMAGLPLVCGFYLNELLLKLLPRDDAHETLFDGYEQALEALREGAHAALVLRRFERLLLSELGYGLSLASDARGAPIAAEREYVYVVERGAVPAEQLGGDPVLPALRGSALLAIAHDDYSDPAVMPQARGLMRYILNHYLGGRELYTRQLLREMQQP
ncbi:MAG: DNA repair protein RecO [Burkholderiales bacterium]|nr:DNA repair protein RecO [Burkholderiales bacterium]